MFKIKSEKNFIDMISTLDVEIVQRSHRNVSYTKAMNYLKFWSKGINKILVAYEVALNTIHFKYPDFLLLFNNKSLRIEIKDKESEQTIAKEINSLDKFKENEFWYVLSEHIDKDKVLAYATKKDVRIKVMYANAKLFEKIQSFFAS